MAAAAAVGGAVKVTAGRRDAFTSEAGQDVMPRPERVSHESFFSGFGAPVGVLLLLSG